MHLYLHTHTHRVQSVCIYAVPARCEIVCLCLLDVILKLEEQGGKREKKYARASKIKEQNLAQCHVCF